MNTKLFFIAVAASGAVGLGANAAMAADDDTGIYVGGAVGSVSINDSDFDDDNTANQIFIGARLNEFIGLELSRIDFGNYGSGSINASTDGYSLALAAYLPFTDTFTLYGKAGQFWWDTEVDVLGFEEAFDGSEPYLGAGLLFDITDNLKLDVSYQRLKVDLEEDEIGTFSALDLDAQVNMAAVGLRVNF